MNKILPKAKAARLYAEKFSWDNCFSNQLKYTLLLYHRGNHDQTYRFMEMKDNAEGASAIENATKIVDMLHDLKGKIPS